MKHPKRPRDFAQLAKLVVDIATGTVVDSASEETIGNKARAGRLGGLKGGKARAEVLSPRKRKVIARKAAMARWGKQTG